MLVLSRKTQQSIIIDGRVRVTIQSIKGQRVRIGIEAPREMPVHRGEIAEQISESCRVSSADGQSDDGQSKDEDCDLGLFNSGSDFDIELCGA